MIFYLFPILICILATIFFHLTYIKFNPKPKTFWTKVDYWWVAIGFIGVIGSTYSFKKEYSNVRQPWHRQTIRNYFGFYLEELSQQSSYYLDPNGFDYKLFEDKEQALKYIQAGNFFSHLFQEAKEYESEIVNNYRYDNLDSLNLLYSNFKDTINNAYVINNSQGAELYMKTLLDTADIIETLESQTERNTLDWVLLFFSPILFSTAIALRLTKVTYQLIEDKKKVC